MRKKKKRLITTSRFKQTSIAERTVASSSTIKVYLMSLKNKQPYIFI